MPYALGGAKLEGTRLVRVTYTDESGTNPRDPCMVVGGVVIDGDAQLGPVEDHLEGLVKKHIPEEDREGFYFHASDIWNCNGYFKGKDELWPREKRNQILIDLVDTIPTFKLPVVLGFLRRTKFMAEPGAAELSREQLRVVIHLRAFTDMVRNLELNFRMRWPKENTLLIAEDLPEVRALLRQTQIIMRSPTKLAEWGIPLDVLPLKNIRDTVHFAAKEDSRPLQLADACAFFLRGYLGGTQAHRPYHDVIVRQVLSYPAAEMELYERAKATWI